MSSNQYSAVFFCEEGKIAREMFYVEFEAILDSFIPLPEYAGHDVKAIYVQLTPQVKVESAVYFLIGFDGAGNADKRWNLLLQQLAEQGEAGPNLGAGPIHLVCRSQCPVAWYTQGLWDPDAVSEPNDFVALAEIVKRNKLGFKKHEDDTDTDSEVIVPVLTTTSAAHGQPVSDSDKRLAENLIQFLRKKLVEEEDSERDVAVKTHRLQIATQKHHFQDEVNVLEQQHSEELRLMQQKIHEVHQQLEQEKKQNEKYAQELEEQARVHAQTKQLFEQKLAKNQQSGENQFDALKQDFANELERTRESMRREFSETLAAKDLEILYRDEEKAARDAEIVRLNAERVRLISQGGEEFLQRLAENKLSFVAYHQGTGHITIGIDDIGEYLASPIAYVARHCKVPEALYRHWLKHYESPVCEAYSEIKGTICGKHLKQVVNPSQFVDGRSDRCPLHWTFGDESKARP